MMPFRLIHRSLPKPKWTEITENVSYTQNNPLWEELTCFLLKEDFFLTSDIGVHLQKAGGKLPAGDGVHHRCCFSIRFSLTKKAEGGYPAESCSIDFAGFRRFREKGRTWTMNSISCEEIMTVISE